jgi:hypothetical protein
MGKDNAEGSSTSYAELSQIQSAILVGTLLGDGCLARHGKHHRLHVKHAISQRRLAMFKYAAFREFISMKPNVFDQKLGGRRYPCVQFATRTSPTFTDWHSQFYVGGRKCVPEAIANVLTPLALAVWIMDDGAADYAGITLQTHNYQCAEVDQLIEVLQKKFGLVVNSRKNKGHELIYVHAESVDKLAELVRPYLLEEFEYKLVPRRMRTP